MSAVVHANPIKAKTKRALITHGPADCVCSSVAGASILGHGFSSPVRKYIFLIA